MLTAQGKIDRMPNATWIAEYLIVPKAYQPIPLSFDQPRPRGIQIRSMLPTVDLDHELRSMACKIGDVVPKRHLFAKMVLSEVHLEYAPKHAFRVGEALAKSSGSTNRSDWWVMLQACRPTTKITPPLTLPIKGRVIPAARRRA